MPFIAYVPKKFRAESQDIIDKSNQIINTLRAQGYEISLRQLFYQMVARGWLANTVANYNRLGNIINDARLAGLVDWNAIQDRGRWVRDNSHWDTPQTIMKSVVSSYANEKWATQPERPIVMIEKDALINVIEGVCQELDVPFISCRGYFSASEMWSMSQRLRGYIKKGQRPVILHLGDHDPSGIDMTRDIRERLELFVTHHEGWGAEPEVDRLALNMDQVQAYDPPPNPARETDSRYAKYIDQYGVESWELDALDPPIIGQLIRDAVMAHRDEALWAKAEAKEELARKQLDTVRDRWEDVVDFISNDD